MKKFTALMLVVLMLVMAIPFASSADTKWTEVKTAEDFAAMTDGNYWLTADIDLSKAAWTTLAKFEGTLNGNGHTVTVPADAPIFDIVTGEIKNVNLVGNAEYNSADVSKFFINGDIDGYGLGVLANNAIGAVITNVHSTVTVKFVNDTRPVAPANAPNNAGKDCGVNFGGLVGFTSAELDLKDSATETKEVEGVQVPKKELVIKERTVISFCSVGGSMNLDFVNDDNRNNAGTIVGASYGCVDILNTRAYATVECANSKGNKGGIVGHINLSFYAYNFLPENFDIRGSEHEQSVIINNCLTDGGWNMSGNVGERFGGIVGYGRGFTVTNCANEANNTGAGDRIGIIGYGNSNGTGFSNKVNACISVGPAGGGTYTKINCTKSDDTNKYVCEVTNMYRVDNNTVNGGSGNSNGVMTFTDYSSKDAARAAFVEANGNTFVLTGNADANNGNDGKIALVMPTFTPEANPDFNAGSGNVGGDNNDNVETGDMTNVLLAVSVVALAAVTVIVKKKVTE